MLCAEESSGRSYAMKRMRKSGVVQCPEHVFCEQAITRNTAHPFCIRQYASFQDKYHLYFLFDLMPGGDLMDVLVAEAKVIKRRIAQGAWRRACFAPKVCPTLSANSALMHDLRLPMSMALRVCMAAMNMRPVPAQFDVACACSDLDAGESRLPHLGRAWHQ